MKTRKICLIGDFAVGKTSLVSRYVRSTFSERYISTVGVKVDTKSIRLANGDDVKLVMWDIAGKSTFATIDRTYLRNAAGYLLVIDGTRPDTVGSAIELQSEVESMLGPRPFVTLMNKHDLAAQWQVGNADLATLESRGWQWLRTSARTGTGVDDAFARLGERLLGD